MRSAAWRISLWATLAFTIGTLFAFLFLHRFVEHDITRRSDAWLSGEIQVLCEVAAEAPKGALYSRVVKEVAELASKEVPNRLRSAGAPNDSVFFLQTGDSGSLKLWVGAGAPDTFLAAVKGHQIIPGAPADLHVAGFEVPFRVAADRSLNGTIVYLGLSERDELRVLHRFRIHFFGLLLLIVFLAFGIVFYTTRRMLGHVRRITEAASRIGESDLSRRVPTTQRNDEVSQLAFTLNHMLDRIENAMHELHTITDSLAHDLRSPLTAIRGKLEMSLSADTRLTQTEMAISAIDELDRLAECLNRSLDVSEANANALRLNRKLIDLDELLRSMINLYEPSMSEKGIGIELFSPGPVLVLADDLLSHRMMANLFDNELKHLPPNSTVRISLKSDSEHAVLMFEDDGPGFPSELGRNMFERRVKGSGSSGSGLGLAFVKAVVQAHGGSIAASNRGQGGIQLLIRFPASSAMQGSALSAAASQLLT